MRRTLSRVTLARWLVPTVLALAACGPATPCDQRTDFRNEPNTACQQCQMQQCMAESTALLEMRCDALRACMLRCPANSALTCGCESRCLQGDPCADAWTSWEGCLVRRCASACR